MSFLAGLLSLYLSLGIYSVKRKQTSLTPRTGGQAGVGEPMGID